MFIWEIMITNILQRLAVVFNANKNYCLYHIIVYITCDLKNISVYHNCICWVEIFQIILFVVYGWYHTDK
jgi:hypothetical protein